MTMAKVELVDSITNYKELMFWLRNSNGRIYASATVPVSAFKTFNSEGRSIGLEIYISKRAYASIWYASDTSAVHVSSENNASLYWQILGMK